MTRQQAESWIVEHGKTPLRCDDGRWRWTLGDGSYRGADELRHVIFTRLAGGDVEYPWLFATKVAAIEGLILALMGGQS